MCPLCESPYAILLGTLGSRTHLRCRDCGAGYSTTEPIDLGEE